MSAIDVRTAAQAEANGLYPLRHDADDAVRSRSLRLRQKAFIKGASWGAALVTPTRERIAEVIDANADIHDGIDVYKTADAILALSVILGGEVHE